MSEGNTNRRARNSHRGRFPGVPTLGLAAAALLATGAPLLATTIPTPVLYYNFNGDTTSSGGIADDSGNASPLNGSMAGAGTPFSFSSSVPASISGHTSTSLNLTANASGSKTGSYVDVTGYQGILPSSGFTVTLWVEGDSNNFGTLFQEGTNASGESFDLVDNAGQVEVLYNGGGTDASSSINLNDGNWHFVAVVVPDNNKADDVYYVDNTVATNPYSSGTWSTVLSSDVLFGDSTTANSPTSFNGYLADVALFNTALTSAQIAALYAGQSPVSATPEPACLGLISLGAAGMLMRRRRTIRA